MVGVELEVLAKKFDRFGWDRDRGSMAHDRTVTDWMDALHDYPLDEIQAACRAAVINRPNNMPNEGHIIAAIMVNRDRHVKSLPKLERETYEPVKDRITPEAHAKLMKKHGFDGTVQVKSFNAKPKTSEPEVVPCIQNCLDGHKGMDHCNACGVTGSQFVANGKRFPNTKQGYADAVEELKPEEQE